MKQLPLSRTQIQEFEVYKENEVIVLAFEFSQEVSIEYCMFQIETEISEQRKDKWGMYFEWDEVGEYEAIKEFDIDLNFEILRVILDKKLTQGIDMFLIELPTNMSEVDKELLSEMKVNFDKYPPSCKTLHFI